MSFKAVITDKDIEINGTKVEQLAGLLCYIDYLKDEGISNKIIRKAINLSLEDTKIETIIDSDELKVQKIDLNDMTKEEAKEFFENEILNKLF